jgi:hypothetical protein
MFVSAETPEDWPGRCAGCGQRLGAFEPIVVLMHDGRATTTSLTVALALLRQPEPRGLFHEDCFRRTH